MKRFLSLILALVLMLSLAACGGNNPTPSGDTNKPSNTPATDGDNEGTEGDTSTEPSSSTGTPESQDFQFPADIPAKKVGVVGIFTGNELYIQWKKNLSSLSEKFNVEFQFVEASSTEEVAGAIENLCTAGIDGIMMQSLSENALSIAHDHNVPIVSYCMTYSQDQMDTFASYDNFIGVITEEDIVAATHAAESMYAAGCRKVGIAGLQRGRSQMMDDRADYFKARFQELGGEIIAEDYSLMSFGTTISSFAAAYPDMDGVFSVILNEAVFQTYTTEGLAGYVKLAGFDMSDSCDAYFESGDLVFTCTGQQATIVTAFAPLYNYMYDGTYLIPDRSKMVSRNFVEIHNNEECVNYNEYVRFSTCYSPEEIGYMIVGFNPDYTFEQYEAMHKAFSIEDVMNRMAK